LKIQEDKNGEGLVNQVESVSGEIQLLALNIAVAAAKIAHKQDLGLEVNQRLSQLVNQATQAVRQMNQVLSAAKNNTGKRGFASDSNDNRVDSRLIEGIESSMQSIMSDSEKIIRLLAGVKKR
jgi:methyl-accepting chemotaxis protein